MPLPTKLTKDESRAVAFVGLLLAVSAGARLLERPAPLEIDAPRVDIGLLEAESRRQQELAAPMGAGETIDPNTAPLEQIARLPGASRAVAERVVAERAIAPFRGADELRRVRGVGPATVEKWKPHLRLPDTAPHVAAALSTASRAPERPTAAETPVDLNRATAADLERLPGIGSVLAGRILAWRDSAGGFASVEQLEEVRGVGPAMMRRLAPLVRIGS